MIEGGTFTLDELVRFAGSESLDEMIDAIRKKLNSEAFDTAFEAVKEAKSSQTVEVGLIKAKLTEMERISKLYPMSVAPVIAYLELKSYEVSNLRALARGKESNLPSESIEACMVV